MLKRALLAVSVVALGATAASADCAWNKSAQTPVAPVAAAPVEPSQSTAAAATVTEPVKQEVAQIDDKKPDTPKSN